jgi:hypothetical protein
MPYAPEGAAGIYIKKLRKHINTANLCTSLRTGFEKRRNMRCLSNLSTDVEGSGQTPIQHS